MNGRFIDLFPNIFEDYSKRIYPIRYGHLTWEWSRGIRSYIHPLLISIIYRILAWLNYDQVEFLVCVENRSSKKCRIHHWNHSFLCFLGSCPPAFASLHLRNRRLSLLQMEQQQQMVILRYNNSLVLVLHGQSDIIQYVGDISDHNCA